MWETLVLIAWSDRSNLINQSFTALLALVAVSQVVRFFRFRGELDRWSQIFAQAKLDFEREGSIRLSYALDDLLPPNPTKTQLWVQLPSILMMLGLLGTFIGLTLALALIPFGGDAQQIQQGVKEALPSMGSAFWTSLSALLGSLLVRLCTLSIEGSFKRRVLDYVARADPRLVYQIEQQAFLDNKPGALLRPHPLREVMWQQNNLAKEHLQEMLGQVASAIRELPLALGVNTPLQLPLDDGKPSDLTPPTVDKEGAQGDSGPSDQSELSELVTLVREQNELLRQLVALRSPTGSDSSEALTPLALSEGSEGGLPTLPLTALRSLGSEQGGGLDEGVGAGEGGPQDV